MRNEDYDEFASLLDDAYDLIGSGANKVISAGAKAMFFKAMSKYSLATFRAALDAHCLDKTHGQFVPKPAHLIAQIDARTGGDGRPGADEAWAIALTGQDESETVVWTPEIAEAFGVCKPVLSMGDEVGARMAFKDAYNRIISQARNNRVPVRWLASVGWDVAKREAVLTKAAGSGLLPAPVVAALLPPPVGAFSNDANATAQIEKIKEMMQTMKEERTRQSELHSQRERDETTEAKRKANEMASKQSAKEQGML